ncbi:MAG TPA: phosphoadenylyl-sulfate reductase [Polyangiaceae bacterium]|nr:phosphoadenylyl-sulfate reductase [Polyangiaceae bacterium]
MRITMVKKRLLNGEACPKCIQAQDMLERRGLASRIDRTVWAQEGDAESEGMQLSQKHGVAVAPFFLVEKDDGTTEVVTSALKLMKDYLGGASADVPREAAAVDRASIEALSIELAGKPPLEIVTRVLGLLGRDCAIAFSGAEDVALVDLAVRSGQPFSVFCLDTGRLHAETYRFLDRVRKHYGIEIELMWPSAEKLEPFVRQKGLFSFYEDGHHECCGIRKVEPLRRALATRQGWMTGQRRDQSPTRAEVPELAWDTAHRPAGMPKANPLAQWSQADVWSYIREHDVPYNELHDRGFISIGCEPCTRPARPGEHERAARWWWEESTQRECGLHVDESGRLVRGS